MSCGGTFIDNPPDQTLYFCESHNISDTDNKEIIHLTSSGSINLDLEELLDHLDLELGAYCTCEGDCRFW